MEIQPKEVSFESLKSVGIDAKRFESWRPGFEEWLDKFHAKPRLAQIMHLYIDMLERNRQKTHIRVANTIIVFETIALGFVLIFWH